MRIEQQKVIFVKRIIDVAGGGYQIEGGCGQEKVIAWLAPDAARVFDAHAQILERLRDIQAAATQKLHGGDFEDVTTVPTGQPKYKLIMIDGLDLQ